MLKKEHTLYIDIFFYAQYWHMIFLNLNVFFLGLRFSQKLSSHDTHYHRNWWVSPNKASKQLRDAVCNCRWWTCFAWSRKFYSVSQWWVSKSLHILFRPTIFYFTGNIIGVVRNYRRMIKIFRSMRRAGYISSYVSIYPSHLHRCIYISSDGGRLCRPYIIVENGVPLVTEKHITELEKGIRTFEDFLHDGM